MPEISKNHSTAPIDLFHATVVSADPGTNVVIVAPDGQNNHTHLQGIPISATFSAALGFVETILPTIGTKVLCCGKSDLRTLILGSIPYPDNQANNTDPNLPNKAIQGTLEPLFQSVHKKGYRTMALKSVLMNNNLPTDVLAGEKVISNEFGVMLGLFKLLATLKASELSQIQCHFLDDLVRIISHNFQHYTSLGELKIFHDGQGIHLEMGATHSPRESLGSLVDGSTGIEAINTVKGYDKDYALTDDQLVMLERMKLFVGQLGQFVNLLITNPSQEQHALNGKEPSKPDTGLLQVKASLDGTLVVRSVSGIYLEKTNWIRVPQRIRTPEDPKGDDGTTIEYPEQKAYEFDRNYRFRGEAFLYYLQLRDYLAYINEELGYANFKTHEKDFYVNKDKSKETPLESITYIDKETGIAYTQTKSWVSLMGNGGISLSDAWGSCISMEGGNIYIQPAKDLIVQPNRNLVAKIGGNTSIATRGEIDLSSTEGGMRVKTKEAQYLYSSDGGIVLHTDAVNYEGGIVNLTAELDSMVSRVAGIIFKAPASSINSHASQVYHNALQTYVAKAPVVTISSSNLTRLMSDNQSIIYGGTVLTHSSNQTISYSGGQSTTIGMGGTIVGLKNQNFGVVEFMGGQIPVEGILDPSNNSEQDLFETLSKSLNDSKDFKTNQVLGTFAEDTDFGRLQFQFPPTSIYRLDKFADVIPQTLSQQNDTISGLYGLQNWVETPINSSYPYPGKDFNMSLATATVSNIEAGATSDLVFANKAVDLLNKSSIVVKDLFTDYKSM